MEEAYNFQGESAEIIQDFSMNQACNQSITHSYQNKQQLKQSKVANPWQILSPHSLQQKTKKIFWNPRQEIKFLTFIVNSFILSPIPLISKRIMFRQLFYTHMAESIGDRTRDQCRSHEQSFRKKNNLQQSESVAEVAFENLISLLRQQENSQDLISELTQGFQRARSGDTPYMRFQVSNKRILQDNLAKLEALKKVTVIKKPKHNKRRARR